MVFIITDLSLNEVDFSHHPDQVFIIQRHLGFRGGRSTVGDKCSLFVLILRDLARGFLPCQLCVRTFALRTLRPVK